MTRLELLQSRHSVRSFTSEPLSHEVVKKLKAELTMINTHQQGIKFQFIVDDPQPLKGFSKSYGIFENPRNYMAAVVDTSTPNIMERAGYFAEQFVIKAVELGLGTCFVGGTYKESLVRAQLRAGERILFLVVVGYPKEKARPMAKFMVSFAHRKKMNPSQFFVPESEYEAAIRAYPFLQEGLEGVACAPSALNKRPARVFLTEKDGIRQLCAKVDASNPKNLIDLGIAKFNFNYVTLTECEWGNGTPMIIEE